MKITSRYVLREHIGPLTFSLGALTSLLLLNYIARKFGDLVGRGLPWQAIAEFFVLSVPFTIAMTLPMAVLVSTLYAFSRLASENEITAFKASGVAMSRLLGPVLWGATSMAVLMVLFNDQVLPRANHELSTLQQNIARTTPTFLLREQVLNEVSESFMLRASHVDQAHSKLREVTIYDMSQPSPRTIRADSGLLTLMPNRRDLQLTLFDGTSEELGDGKPEQLRRTFFTTLLYRQRDVVKAFTDTKADDNSFKSDREMSICELQDAYTKSRTEYLRAKLDYDVAVAESHKRPPPKSSGSRKVFLGIGRLYCQGVKNLSNLLAKPAHAQEVFVQPPAAQPPATQPPATPVQPRDTSHAAPVAPSQPRDTSHAVPATPSPAPATPTPATPTPPTVQPPAAAVPTPGAPVPGAPVPGAPVPGAPAPGAPVPGTPMIAPSQGIPPVVNGVPQSVPPAGSVATPLVPPPGPGGPEAQRPIPGTSVVDIARMRVTETLGNMNNYDVEIHKKFALAVACIVFVLLGAPVALRFPRGGVGLTIGVSLFVFAAYYSFLIAGEELASRGMLPPWIAMWAANVVFTAAAIPLAMRMGRESGSARGGGLAELLDRIRFRKRRQAASVPATQS